MTNRLANGGDPGATRVDVVSNINLAGPLAQFDKGVIVQEIVNRITLEFVKNFERRLSDAAEPVPGTGPQTLNAGALVWSIVREKVRAFFEASLPTGRKRNRK